MMRLTRSNPSCPSWRSPCRRAVERVSAQSPLSGAPGAPVAVLLAGHLLMAVRSPCFRGALDAQREAESTRRPHVVPRLAASAPFRSCTFTRWLAGGATPTPGQRGQDKRGRHCSAGTHREIKAAPRGADLRHVPVSPERPTDSKIAAAPSHWAVPALRRLRIAAYISVIPLPGAPVHDPEHADSRNGDCQP
jgi:hypothetical protein